MSKPFTLDRETFQRLLAGAYALQESHLDSRSLSAIMEVQRMVPSGEINLENAMDVLVESARTTANAAGVAIGLLEGDRLTYRAGSGFCAPWVGSRVRASLTFSATTDASREILRVENAPEDSRIEAAICRQFGAKSLLILPICHDRDLVGVIEVLFTEAHTFGELEVHAYRLMAAVIETALLQSSRVEQSELNEELPAIPQAAKEYTPEPRWFLKESFAWLGKGKDAIYRRGAHASAAARKSPNLSSPGSLAKAWWRRAQEIGPRYRVSKDAAYQQCAGAWAAARKLPILNGPILLTKTWRRRTEEIKPHYHARKNEIYQRWAAGALAARKSLILNSAGLRTRPWRRWAQAINPRTRLKVGLAAAGLVCVLILWGASNGRSHAPSLGSSVTPQGTDKQQASSQPGNARAAEGVSNSKPTPVSAIQTKTAKTRVRQARTGGSEVHYIGEDVTVHIFAPKPVRRRKLVESSRVAYIGDDVTVRYFTPKPTPMQHSR